MSIIEGLRAPYGISRSIGHGDLVVVYERFDAMKTLIIDEKGRFQNRYGVFEMKDWIGKPYGSKFASKSGEGWIHVLSLTPELWTLVLRHRTQILYLADISMICSQLDLRPGCTVLESGTGSGSLTTSLARTVAPTGRVLTFEFHQERSEVAKAEFIRNGIDHLVTVEHRNIEENGFPESLHGQADAVFLDLPGPWRAVPSASACLRPDGMFCGFSPCMEQVQRTCEALNANGFKDTKTIELLLREIEVIVERKPTPLSGLLCQQQETLAEGPGQQHGRKKPKVERYSRGNAAHEDDGDGVAVVGKDRPRRGIAIKPIAQGKGHTGFLTFARKAVDL